MREEQGVKVVLPVTHELDETDLISAYPSLSDRLRFDTANGLEEVILQIQKVVINPDNWVPRTAQDVIAHIFYVPEKDSKKGGIFDQPLNIFFDGQLIGH